MMDQPSKGVFKNWSSSETFVQMSQRYSFAPKVVPPLRVHVSLHAVPRTQTEILLQRTVLSAALLTDISASSTAAPAQLLWQPSARAATALPPPSHHSGISQPEVSLLNHPLIQYQKILLVWKGVKREQASHPATLAPPHVLSQLYCQQTAYSPASPNPHDQGSPTSNPLGSHPNCFQADSSYSPHFSIAFTQLLVHKTISPLPTTGNGSRALHPTVLQRNSNPAPADRQLHQPSGAGQPPQVGMLRAALGTGQLDQLKHRWKRSRYLSSKDLTLL